MKRLGVLIMTGIAAACISSSAFARVDVGVFVGIPFPVIQPPLPPVVVYREPPPVVYRAAPAVVYGPSVSYDYPRYYYKWEGRHWRDRDWDRDSEHRHRENDDDD